MSLQQLQAFLDADGDGALSLEEIKRVVQISSDLYIKSDQLQATMTTLINTVRSEICNSGLSPKAEFEKIDTDLKGMSALRMYTFHR